MLTVVAGVMRDPTGRLLLSQRLPGKHLAGRWEFPGGKCERGESPSAALARELHEELGIRVRQCSPLMSLTHHYPERTVRLLLRSVHSWDGEARGVEGQAIAWYRTEQVGRLPLPSADRPLLKLLDLDPRCLTGLSIDENAPATSVLARWQDLLANGFAWLVLALAEGAGREALAVAEQCGRLARSAGAKWVLEGSAGQARRVGADGVLLSRAELMAAPGRPLPEADLVAVRAASLDELQRAGEIGADCILLQGDRMSIDRKSSGLEHFGHLIERSPLPILAPDLLCAKRLADWREVGAFGVHGPCAEGVQA